MSLDELQPTDVYGTRTLPPINWERNPDQPARTIHDGFLSDEKMNQLLMGQFIIEVIIKSSEFDDNRLLLVLANKSHLYNANCEGGNILQLDLLDEHWSNDLHENEYRRYFDGTRCDFLGRVLR